MVLDSIAVPESSTFYKPTSNFYKHNMFKASDPITRKDSYIRRSSRYVVYEMKKGLLRVLLLFCQVNRPNPFAP